MTQIMHVEITERIKQIKVQVYYKDADGDTQWAGLWMSDDDVHRRPKADIAIELGVRLATIIQNQVGGDLYHNEIAQMIEEKLS